MAVKTITITEDAYDAVRRIKQASESFSDLFLRIGKKKATISDIIGKLKTTPEDGEDLMRSVRKVREGLAKGFERRASDVRARLERTD